MQPNLQTLFQCLSSYFHPLFFSPIISLTTFFQFKDRAVRGLRTCVVYRFNCQSCSTFYVGQANQQLHPKISDHLGISALIGKKHVSPSSTSILTCHQNICICHPISPDDFTIISSCSSSSSCNLLIRASLLIKKLNPTLNFNISSIQLFLCWRLHLSSSPLMSFHRALPLKCQIILINP